MKTFILSLCVLVLAAPNGLWATTTTSCDTTSQQQCSNSFSQGCGNSAGASAGATLAVLGAATLIALAAVGGYMLFCRDKRSSKDDAKIEPAKAVAAVDADLLPSRAELALAR